MSADRCTTLLPPRDSTTRIEVDLRAVALGPTTHLHADAALVDVVFPLRPPEGGALVRPRGAVGKTLRARRGGTRG